MTRSGTVLAIATSIALSGCASIGAIPTERLGSARLTLANGVPAGTAQLLANGNGVSIAVAITGIDQGAHGFHLHQTGECRRPDFSSAGGHLNPMDRDHGELSPGGKHLGDLPNLEVGPNGSASATFDIEGSREDVLDYLFDADGTAIVVHAGADDYRTDPSGAAGSRIACGVLKRS
uniref:superoxide dismutase family protein n=1 Tax=Parerythrobacter lutipelagi TaxID=1964208 RepID=UPI0010F70F5A|nr:superoxide dismutase family protein [Parerythrobacter lutipelagi]